MISPLLRLPGILLLGALVLSLPSPSNHASANDVYLESTEGELLNKYITPCPQPVPATPQLFGTPEPNNPIWRSQVLEPIENLRRRGLQIFSRDEIAQIFAEIGGSQDLELLEKYAQFSQFNKGDRKVRFNQISPKEKSDLWRVHLGLNLARHAEWTDQQRSIVLEAIGIASPSLYQLPKDKDWTRLVDEPIRLFAQRALLVFSEQEAAALFAELGADEPKAHHAKLTIDGSCTCSSVSTWCTYSCFSTDCTVLTWGCGTVGLYACDGKCSSPNRRD